MALETIFLHLSYFAQIYLGECLITHNYFFSDCSHYLNNFITFIIIVTKMMIHLIKI